jgi:hypothetical protein
MDLESLDWRRYRWEIEQERLRMDSRPIEIAIEDVKHTFELELKYLAGLRDVATPEEACELDVQLERLRAQLARINIELATRADAEEVDPLMDLPHGESTAESGATTPENAAIEYSALFKQVLEKRNEHGESKENLQAAWLNENPTISRTQLTDYLGGRIKGRVSASKCAAIQDAILASAATLGLTAPTRSE